MSESKLDEFVFLVRRAGLPVDRTELEALLPTYLDLQQQVALFDAHIEPHLEPSTVFRHSVPDTK